MTYQPRTPEPYGGNPFGFVYGGALAANVEGAVNVHPISYDAAGVEAAIAEALTWEGVYFVKVWLNEGVLDVGESIMYVMIGADIRPRCIDALQNLVGKIKNDLVVEKEIYA